MSSFEENYQKAVQASALIVTKEMIEQAKGNKVIAIFQIEASDFLDLTTTREYGNAEISKEAKSVAEYNQLAKDGRTIIMPFLSIAKETGRVKGHEGRHRAAALTKEAGPHAKLSVAMMVKDKNDIYRYYVEDKERRKTYLGIDYVPTFLYGQFRPEVMRSISPRGAKELWK